MALTSYDIYLNKLSETGSNFIAEEASALSDKDIQTKIQQDSNFSNLIDKAKDKSLDILLQEARRRAMGYEENVIIKGEFVGTRVIYSDSLMMFLLKNMHPAFLNDGSNDNIITVNINDPTV